MSQKDCGFYKGRSYYIIVSKMSINVKFLYTKQIQSAVSLTAQLNNPQN